VEERHSISHFVHHIAFRSSKIIRILKNKYPVMTTALVRKEGEVLAANGQGAFLEPAGFLGEGAPELALGGQAWS
jgi:hypothetical protein